MFAKDHVASTKELIAMAAEEFDFMTEKCVNYLCSTPEHPADLDPRSSQRAPSSCMGVAQSQRADSRSLSASSAIVRISE